MNCSVVCPQVFPPVYFCLFLFVFVQFRSILFVSQFSNQSREKKEKKGKKEKGSGGFGNIQVSVHPSVGDNGSRSSVLFPGSNTASGGLSRTHIVKFPVTDVLKLWFLFIATTVHV